MDQADDDVQRVDVETEADPAGGGRRGAPGGFAFRFGKYGGGDPDAPARKPPVVAAWACLVLAWLFLGSGAPFTVLLGAPFALAALLCAAVCLTRGATLSGLAVLALGSVGSFAVYQVGLFRFFFE